MRKTTIHAASYYLYPLGTENMHLPEPYSAVSGENPPIILRFIAKHLKKLILSLPV
jgi:hypothetical protein